MKANIASAINAYPEALAMTDDKRLISFNLQEDNVVNGLLVTRPLKLELRDILKTVNQVIQRGKFNNGDVTTVLYGSRNLINWQLVGSSRNHRLNGLNGTPYKYFRIAATAKLDTQSYIEGASINFKTKYTNKLR